MNLRPEATTALCVNALGSRPAAQGFFARPFPRRISLSDSFLAPYDRDRLVAVVGPPPVVERTSLEIELDGEQVCGETDATLSPSPNLVAHAGGGAPLCPTSDRGDGARGLHGVYHDDLDAVAAVVAAAS